MMNYICCARASALRGRKLEKWPLVASNDLRGKKEYACILNVMNVNGVCEIKLLAKIGHFGVKKV